MNQAELDQANADFWNHICGASLARRIRNPTIRNVDQAYLALYPWLEQTVRDLIVPGARVLEVGPGYGTVGRLIVAAGGDYHAIDIAPNVIEHTRQHTSTNALRASVLDLDHVYPAGSFRTVVAIGSLHHTGNLPLALQQVHRVLEPDGELLAMLYGDGNVFDYDPDTGAQAPHTDITPPDQIDPLFAAFRDITVTLRRPHEHTDIYVHATK
jgi:SAM-dependent methyltransferase